MSSARADAESARNEPDRPSAAGQRRRFHGAANPQGKCPREHKEVLDGNRPRGEGELRPGPYVDCPEEGCVCTLQEGVLHRHSRGADLVIGTDAIPVRVDVEAVEDERPRTAEAILADPLAVPAQLPARRYGRGVRLQSLSPASLRAFEKCPEAFRRQYLLGEKVAPNLSMTLGSVVGDALSHYFQGRIGRRPPAPADLDDLVLELFASKIVETVLGLDDDPELGKAQCRSAVADYLVEIAPQVEPVSVERRASFRFNTEQDWRFVCYFDLECVRVLADLKFGYSTVKEERAYRDLQATAQIFMRWAEGNPAEFVFHAGTLERPEEGPRWRVVPAPRSVSQLLGFQRRVARVARLIAYLDQTEPAEWPLSSDLGWWCAPRVGTEGCPHWERCPVGGAMASA